MGDEGQVFLFLQGPLSPFFARLGEKLAVRGHRVLRINLNLGDRLLWPGANAIDYRGSVAGWPSFVDAFMRRESVTDLVLLGEQRPHHLDAIAAAKRLGARVFVTDFGYLRPDWITLEPDGMSGWSRFPRDPAAIRRLAADSPVPDLSPRYFDSFPRQALWEVAYHVGNWLSSPLYPGYRSHQIHHPVPNYLATGLRLLSRSRNNAAAQREIERVQGERAPYWVFLMQMEVDYSIRAYSPYPDMSAPLRQTLRAFAEGAPADGRLLVKLHPLDPGLRPWRRRIAAWAQAEGVAERVSFLDGGALDPLLSRAAGVVTVNSTAGLRALQLGTPVKALGSAIWDVDGLTHQGPLSAFWTQGQPPDPGLLEAFVRAAADFLHVRGVYYRDPGLDAAAAAAALRLDSAAVAAWVGRMSRAAAPD